MTGSQGLKSVNCTSCGAGLSVLGGGRVLSHACGYCGAVLDAQDNYKILQNLGKRDHPNSPVKIGMTIELDGVEFTVIGTLGIVENYRGRTWRWVEHQIFSPTHGYLWLNVEDGNLTFTRKVRNYNMGHWLSPSTVERAETPPTRSYNGEKFKYYDTSVTQIDFMEGEFNWVPKLGEKKTVVSLLGPDTMLSLVKSQTEREVEVTKLLDRDDAAKQLGFAPSALGAAQPHPLTPYQPLPEEPLLRRALLLTMAASLILGILFLFSPGRAILETPNVALSALPESYSFEVTNTSQLARIQFRSNFSNQWASIAAEIVGPDGQPVIAGERSISYYSGRSGGESWSEGSRNASFRFRPQETGTHQVRLELSDPGSNGSGGIALRIQQGKPTGFWLFVLAGVSGLGALLVTARKAAHTKRRFAGSDWHED